MKSVQDQQRLAEGQIQIGIVRLADKYPFHARTLEKFVLKSQPDVETMGVMVAENMIQLLYAPEFVLSISLAELIGVLLHEVHHVVFRHVLADPADFPDEWARTVAEEVTVNEFVTEPLPGNPITLKQFPALKPRRSTRERYERLRQRIQRPPLEKPKQCALPSSDPMGDGGNLPQPSDGNTGENNDKDGNAEGEKRGPGKGRGQSLTVTDNHSVWQAALSDPGAAETTIRAAMQEVVSEVGVENIPEHLRQPLKELLLLMPNQGIGDSPGNGEYEMQGEGRGQINWVQLLRRYIGQWLVVSPDFARPARRFPNLVGVVPGKKRRGRKPNIMAVIDTSGSITDKLLEQINAELARLNEDYSVTVVECDCQIHRVYQYKRIKDVKGRGGTCFFPPFESAFLRQHRPDLIIYFTDGEGLAPEAPPRQPVVWCLTHDGVAPCKWGRVIRMNNVPSHKTN